MNNLDSLIKIFDGILNISFAILLVRTVWNKKDPFTLKEVLLMGIYFSLSQLK